MPFSHIQQRTLVKMAFLNNINIIISDHLNCIRHIISDKPNVMVSVPVIYDIIASRIRAKVKQFSPRKKKAYELYKRFNVNTWSDWNPIKSAFGHYLFRSIRKLYGGKASYFIVGSAKSNIDTITTFYDVGVRILESYGQSESGIISMNSHRDFKVGSVGKPGPDVKIAEDGEVLVRVNENYYHKYNRDMMVIDENNYIHTGDVGYLDKDGFLFLKGRKDEVIVLENGLKVFSGALEDKLKDLEGVQQAVVFSEGGKGLKAILSAVENFPVDRIKKAVEKMNREGADYELIKEFAIDYDTWMSENGFMTSTFKLKRNKIIEQRHAYKFYLVNDPSFVTL